jgi:hypothetical protein
MCATYWILNNTDGTIDTKPVLLKQPGLISLLNTLTKIGKFSILKTLCEYQPKRNKRSGTSMDSM